MISQKLQTALNKQIHLEFHSAYAYLAMSAYFDEQGLPGFAHWMRLQSQEEANHATRLFDYMLDRNGKIALANIQAPPADFDSTLSVFENALAHEKNITKSIHDLYSLAVEEGDYPTQTQLHWFIDEQVEEEKSADDAVTRLKLAANQPSALLLLDQEFAKQQAGGPSANGSAGGRE